MSEQVAVSPEALLDVAAGDAVAIIGADLAYRRFAIVNVVFVGPPEAGDRGWVLVDAGLAGTAALIRAAAAERFGREARPAAIVLTHGHFDHVGALVTLAQDWDVPVYAHVLEHPYLDGTAHYPPADPTVGGGAMAALSRLYPTAPVDVGDRLKPLPGDGRIAELPGWTWIHTPGHSVGHVSLWRQKDHLLIAGDALITTRQESAYAVATQKAEIHGPPTYFTTDWDRAASSVRTLAALGPEVLIGGHGAPMHGPLMRAAVAELARRFEAIAVPPDGTYVRRPVRQEDGTAYR